MIPLGGKVLEACEHAKAALVLCAPFAKERVVQRLIASTPAHVEVELFTRWRPDEVAAGVSDTGVLRLLQDRGGSVFLCDRLHAKLVRADDRALIGSANLTATALGWTTTPNLEILVEVAAQHPAVVELEELLRRESMSATQELADEVERVAALLPPMAPLDLVDEAADQPTLWHPRLREPRDLYVAYSRGVDRLSRASAEAAAHDLAALQLPVGLPRTAFNELVANRMLQSPVVRRVDDVLEDSQRFGAVRDLLAEMLDLERDEASYAWQTLMRWLLEFMPRRYSRSVPRWSEILVRRGAVGAEE